MNLSKYCFVKLKTLFQNWIFILTSLGLIDTGSEMNPEKSTSVTTSARFQDCIFAIWIMLHILATLMNIKFSVIFKFVWIINGYLIVNLISNHIFISLQWPPPENPEDKIQKLGTLIWKYSMNGPSWGCFPECFLKCAIFIFPRPLHCHNLHFITHFFISSVGLMKEKWIPFSQLGIVFVLFVLQSFISLIVNIKRSTWNRHFWKKLVFF